MNGKDNNMGMCTSKRLQACVLGAQKALQSAGMDTGVDGFCVDAGRG